MDYVYLSELHFQLICWWKMCVILKIECNKFQYSKFILSTLQHYKLSDSSGTAYIATLTGDSDRRYFAKFLTSQKLLELQLSDSNFRRYVLVQFLILFQYLTLPVKSKPWVVLFPNEYKKWLHCAYIFYFCFDFLLQR